MDYYDIREIRPSEQGLMDDLLERSGLKRDPLLDYCAGVFDGHNLIACGSCAGNTLRCLAVDPDRRGEGLLGRIIQHLIQEEYARGVYHIFIYTKPASALQIEDMGFAEIVRDQYTVFMENRKSGFDRYLSELKKESIEQKQPIGAIVMNANPFTLGHQYLVEKAASACGTLHLFVVSEDASLFPAKDRFDLVRAGTEHIDNVIYHHTDNYLISRATFPSYFLPDDDIAAVSQARIDAQIFIKIAKELGIMRRFLGSEPVSRVTALYNQVLSEVLPKNGIECTVIPRLETDDLIISASTVRKYLKEENWERISKMVPATTLDYLRSRKGAAVITRISSNEERSR